MPETAFVPTVLGMRDRQLEAHWRIMVEAIKAGDVACERRIRSVWGNLSIEHPEVTLEDVRKALGCADA